MHILFVALLLSAATGRGFSQTLGTGGPPPFDPEAVYRVRTLYYVGYEVDQGDTMRHFRMTPVPIFSKILIDRQKHWRLIRNVKAAYPIALYANKKLAEMEVTMASMKSRREQERYMKQMEKELKEQYTPIIKNMSFSQGKVLIKLIDRQTGHTSYDLVKDLRGSFSAFFWQNLGRLFGMNLKEKYDSEGEDKLIEQVITYYEAGLL
jgi:hypothetical protein